MRVAFLSDVEHLKAHVAEIHNVTKLLKMTHEICQLY